MVPGSGFGAPGHMRLSFACSMQTLEKALDRIARVLARARRRGLRASAPEGCAAGASRDAMIWSLLADVLVVIHFAFTAFVIFGGFLTWRWPRVALLHLPALAWGCWVEVSHTLCPLTPLENHLRHLGGEAGYSGGFLAHYLVRGAVSAWTDLAHPVGAGGAAARPQRCGICAVPAPAAACPCVAQRRGASLRRGARRLHLALAFRRRSRAVPSSIAPAAPCAVAFSQLLRASSSLPRV